MVIKENLIYFVQVAFSMFFMIFAAKYLYHERCFTGRKAWTVFGVMFSAGEAAAMLLPSETAGEIMPLIMVAAFSIMIAVTREKRRIRGMFLFLPVIGIVMSVEMIPNMLIMLFTGESIDYITENIWYYELIFDLAVYTFIYLWLKKKKALTTVTELSIWDRRMLNGNGLVLLLIYTFVISIPESLFEYEHYFLAGGAVISTMIVITSIIMTIDGSNANYYKLISEVNEHYLKAQFDHFQAYQATQLETRRIRHDMKNHLICAMDFFNRGKFEALGQYLKELTDLTQNIDREYHIGNDIADAIINEKFTAAKHRGIDFSIEGNMSGINDIALIDVCTIFANALDNAIEAVERAELHDVIISISVKRDRKLLFISFSNPCKDNVDTNKLLTTSKKDTANHGFGVENIKWVADKYKGGVKYYIEKNDEGQNQFYLEIMLMV